MSYNTLVNTIPITPNSLKEVKSTGLKDLKALCKDEGINIDGVVMEDTSMSGS
jgi:hypothetical protein